MSSRTTITSSTLLLKTPTVRTTSQKSSLSMDLGEFWGLPCAMCTVQWSVHESATALPIFHWKLSNIVKTAKNISTIIIISSFAWFLIAVATRCHLHGNNLDYSIQARGAANSNSFDNISIFQYSIWQYSNGSYCVKTAKNNSIIIIIIIISALAWL